MKLLSFAISGMDSFGVSSSLKVDIGLSHDELLSNKPRLIFCVCACGYLLFHKSVSGQSWTIVIWIHTQGYVKYEHSGSLEKIEL